MNKYKKELLKIFKAYFPNDGKEHGPCACLGLDSCQQIDCGILQELLADKIILELGLKHKDPLTASEIKHISERYK